MQRHPKQIAFIVVASSMLALASANAQTIGPRANNHLAGTCNAAACSWLVFVNDVPVGSVTLPTSSWTAVQLTSVAPFTSTDLFQSLIDCPACKVNTRPFVVPPGILEKLAKHRGTEVGNDESGDDDADGMQRSEPSQQAQAGPPGTPAGFDHGSVVATSVGGATGQTGTVSPPGQSSTGGFTAASTPSSVVVTPEPATSALLWVGLVALTPMVIRSRHRAR